MLTVILLGLTALTTNHALAWPEGCDRCGENIGLGEPPGPQSYDNGWQAGLQDAIYDHDNSLSYNPVGSCYSCHSELYWSGFHGGYDQQCGSYQFQQSSQGASINVINSPGAYVSTNQYSNQQQNPLQGLGHSVCEFSNCGGLEPQAYGP